MKTSDLHLVDRSRPGEFLLRVGHTAEIDASTLAQARELLDVVFEGENVLPLHTPLDIAGDLTCDWRDGDVW